MQTVNLCCARSVIPFLAYFHRKQGNNASLTNRFVKDKGRCYWRHCFQQREAHFVCFIMHIERLQEKNRTSNTRRQVCEDVEQPGVCLTYYRLHIELSMLAEKQCSEIASVSTHSQSSQHIKRLHVLGLFQSSLRSNRSSSGREYPSYITLPGNPTLYLQGRGGRVELVSSCQTLLWKIMYK